MSFAALCEAKEVIGMEIVDSAVADAETGQRAADMNYDGKINVNDIVAIINIHILQPIIFPDSAPLPLRASREINASSKLKRTIWSF